MAPLFRRKKKPVRSNDKIVKLAFGAKIYDNSSHTEYHRKAVYKHYECFIFCDGASLTKPYYYRITNSYLKMDYSSERFADESEAKRWCEGYLYAVEKKVKNGEI